MWSSQFVTRYWFEQVLSSPLSAHLIIALVITVEDLVMEVVEAPAGSGKFRLSPTPHGLRADPFALGFLSFKNEFAYAYFFV
jgi:hypothetical protein